MTLSERFAPDELETYELGHVRVSLEDDVSVIVLVGEIDLSSAESLEDARRDVLDRGLPVRLDASRLTFIDSTGLGVVTRIAESATTGGRVTMMGASRLVRETVELLGLSQVIDLA
jgi:anti-sigma B factor antagonist